MSSTDAVANGSRDYNPIYEKLVDEADHELIGLVAYALYKRSKREWASNIRARDSRGPTPEQLDGFVETWTSDRLEGLRIEARSVLTDFAGEVVDSERPHIVEDALRGTFWGAVWPSVVAALIYTGGLISVAIILKFAGVDLIGIYQGLSDIPWASPPLGSIK